MVALALNLLLVPVQEHFRGSALPNLESDVTLAQTHPHICIIQGLLGSFLLTCTAHLQMQDGPGPFLPCKTGQPQNRQGAYYPSPSRQNPPSLFPSYHHAGKYGHRPRFVPGQIPSLLQRALSCHSAVGQGSLLLWIRTRTRPYPRTRNLPMGSSGGCQEQTPDVHPTAGKKKIVSKTRLGGGILLVSILHSSRRWVRSPCPAKTPGLEMQKVIK